MLPNGVKFPIEFKVPWALGLWWADQRTGGKLDYHDCKEQVLDMLAHWKENGTRQNFPYASVYGSLEQALREMMVLRSPVGMLTTGHLCIFLCLRGSREEPELLYAVCEDGRNSLPESSSNAMVFAALLLARLEGTAMEAELEAMDKAASDARDQCAFPLSRTHALSPSFSRCRPAHMHALPSAWQRSLSSACVTKQRLGACVAGPVDMPPELFL